MKPVTISNKNATQGFVRFSIRATAESDAPPILNAFEVYKLVTDLNSPTDIKDGMYVFHLYIYIYIYLSILLFNHQQICFHQFLGSYTVTHNCIWKLQLMPWRTSNATMGYPEQIGKGTHVFQKNSDGVAWTAATASILESYHCEC